METPTFFWYVEESCDMRDRVVQLLPGENRIVADLVLALGYEYE